MEAKVQKKSDTANSFENIGEGFFILHQIIEKNKKYLL